MEKSHIFGGNLSNGLLRLTRINKNEESEMRMELANRDVRTEGSALKTNRPLPNTLRGEQEHKQGLPLGMLQRLGGHRKCSNWVHTQRPNSSSRAKAWSLSKYGLGKHKQHFALHSLYLLQHLATTFHLISNRVTNEVGLVPFCLGILLPCCKREHFQAVQKGLTSATACFNQVLE